MHADAWAAAVVHASAWAAVHGSGRACMCMGSRFEGQPVFAWDKET